MRPNRRMLASLAAFAVAVPLAYTAATMPDADAAVPSTIPLELTNNSGRSEAMYVYVLGQNLTTAKLGYADAGGAFHEWGAGGLPPTPAPDVAIPGPANGQSTTIQIPKLSGRVYFSFGEKMQFFLTPTGLVQPAPWNPSDPNRDILFDWSEFTLNDSGLWINSSQVDMFSIPHAVGVKTADGTVRTTGRLHPDGRNAVFGALADQPGDWGKLIYTRPSDGLRLRALAPGKGIDAGLLSPTIMDGYIAEAWRAYADKALTVVPFGDRPEVKYFGRTQGDAMVFTDSSGQQVATFQKPSTANVFGCDGALAAPNDNVVGPISRTLCAALNRSTLHSGPVQPTTDAGAFYQGEVANHYAREIHEQMVDGKAYAFAFDDVGNFESLVHDGNPAAASITIDKI